MKKLSLLMFAIIFGTLSAFAQAPERISFQAEVRNSSNVLVVSAPVRVRLSVLQTSTTGTAVYVETHNPTTSANGVVNIQLGGGTVVSGVFANINWASGAYFLRSEIDPANNPTPVYTLTTTSQLLSVPYSLYAKSSGNPKILNGTTNPANTLGANGDYYINRTTNILFGPRSATAWPTTGLSLGGAAFLSGTTAPANTLGNAGDYYLNKTTNKLIGPKTTVWPTINNPMLFEHYVGELWGGGIVFNVWKDAAGVEHGLIASLNNISNGTQVWSNIDTDVVSNSMFYDGRPATAAIIGQVGHTTSAALLCDNYSVPGFSDWYMPSGQELLALAYKSHELNMVLDANPAYDILYNTVYASSTDHATFPPSPTTPIDQFVGVQLIQAVTGTYYKSPVQGVYVRAIRRF